MLTHERMRRWPADASVNAGGGGWDAISHYGGAIGNLTTSDRRDRRYYDNRYYDNRYDRRYDRGYYRSGYYDRGDDRRWQRDRYYDNRYYNDRGRHRGW
ncbi:hypothetical protein G6F32_013676 [Rhizopus arrhizus]|nr:hypothetical protein G6F32_013676 [Rhizopus arrhizus]